MNLNAVLSKTAKGAEEIETRKYKLAQRLRTLLIVVNGKSPVSELVAKFESIGDVTPMLEQLVADGFIAEARAAPDFPAARAQLARAMLDALGPDGDSITEKIEACQSAQELRDYINAKRGALEAALGRRGDRFWKLSKELIG